MNCCLMIILILLFCNGNQGEYRGEGYYNPESSCGCNSSRADYGHSQESSCGCGTSRSELRPYTQYEPRTCGCEEQS